jgi:hypothetical protein
VSFGLHPKRSYTQLEKLSAAAKPSGRRQWFVQFSQYQLYAVLPCNGTSDLARKAAGSAEQIAVIRPVLPITDKRFSNGQDVAQKRSECETGRVRKGIVFRTDRKEQ